MDPIIRVEGLSKRYLLRHQAERGRDGLRHVLQRAATAPWRALIEGMRGGQRAGDSDQRTEGGGQRFEDSDQVTDSQLPTADCRSLISASGTREEFWALNDVSFEVKRGEVVGIIGRNGAGKSTLLKILSRITEPSRGRVELDGRVASLLEVGTGFHADLTGRENIFLNGTILGMSRAEVRRKFDEIVAFAEVEKFLDTPVKRYSSGMHVRLAFAVAAHLEPEILIVDEVLAVGDAEFQKKCLGKMRNVSRLEGRTVLFVSHNLAAVNDLCSRGLVLQEGRIACDDTASTAVRYYGLGISSLTEVRYPAVPHRPAITWVSLDPAKAREGCLEVELGFESPFRLQPIPGIVLFDGSGAPVYGTNTLMHRAPPFNSATKGTLRMSAPALPLRPGFYSVSFFLGNPYHDYDEKRDALRFEFGGKRPTANMPPADIVGPLEWPALWTSIE